MSYEAEAFDDQDLHDSYEELTAQKAKERWLEGDYSATGYLYQLIRSMRGEGRWLRISNVSQFCKKWEISREAFYRAKTKLIEQGRIQERDGFLDLRAVSGDRAREV